MADLKISQLNAGNPAQSGDLIPIARNVSGTETNFSITAGSISSTINPVVFYSTQYTGTTVDIRLNACVAAAIAAQGTCDATAEVGAQTIASTLQWGNSSNGPVRILLPQNAIWTCSITNNTPCVIQYGNSYVKAESAGGISSFYIQVTSATPVISYMYTTSLGTGGYVHLEGVEFFNTGVATTSGVGFLFAGGFDQSTVSHVTVSDGLDTVVAEITTTCCSSSFYNFELSGRDGAGIPLWINTNTSTTNDSINFFSLVANDPGAGLPNIKFTDSSSGHHSKVSIFGLYEESNTADTTTTANQVDGMGMVNVVGFNYKAINNASTAAAWSLTNTFNSQLNILGGVMENYASLPTPVTALVNNNLSTCPSAPCNFLTDGQGNFKYFSGVIQADHVSTLGFASFGGTVTTGGLKYNNQFSFSSSGGVITLGSGWGSGASVTATNSTEVFTINVGTGGGAFSGIVNLPTAANGWICTANDITTTSSTVYMTKQTASTVSSVTLTNYNTLGTTAAWTASDILSVRCAAY